MMKKVMVIVSVLVAIFVAGCQQKSDFESCIEYLERHGGQTKDLQMAIRWTSLCIAK